MNECWNVLSSCGQDAGFCGSAYCASFKTPSILSATFRQDPWIRQRMVKNPLIQNSHTYEADNSLRESVLMLQKFEDLLKEEQRNGTVNITSKTIETDKTFKQ